MIFVDGSGKLEFKGKTYPCAVGKNGIKQEKREGDGASPTGTFKLLYGFYRADRLEKPECSLNFTALSNKDGWCDDPASSQYNKHVTLPFGASHEELWRNDCIYDIILVLSHNTNPTVAGLGSAVFFHLARDNYEGTEGCIAVKQDHMLEILKDISKDEEITISL